MNSFEFRELGIDVAFDPNDLCKGVPFTQERFYGEWQKSLHRSARRFVVSCGKEIVAYFQLVTYPLVFGKKYMYIPYGPVTKDFSQPFFIALKKELEKIARAEDCVFVRLDFTPPVPNSTLSNYFTKAPLYTYHAGHFQPRSEWFLDLGKSEDELLSAMHEKTRYSIRVSSRKGVTAEIITKDFGAYFDMFYALMAETAHRNGFSLHEKAYYEHIFKKPPPGAYLSIARYEQKILAIDLIIISGTIANYVFGGSSTEERNRMPTYLAQWRAICHAKQCNCSAYNFGGIAATDAIYKGWHGLTQFKLKFSGREIRHSDFFDIVINPFWYWLYAFRKYSMKINQ